MKRQRKLESGGQINESSTDSKVQDIIKKEKKKGYTSVNKTPAKLFQYMKL